MTLPDRDEGRGGGEPPSRDTGDDRSIGELERWTTRRSSFSAKPISATAPMDYAFSSRLLLHQSGR